MGIFDIFKKKSKASSPNNILDQLASGKIKVPKEKLHKIKITHEEFIEYSNDRHKNHKTLETLPKKDYPTLGGRIVGYHPNPKDIITKLMAVVGFWFGWVSIPFTIFISSAVALVLVVPSLIKKTRNMSAQIPFGPYIIIGCIIYVTFANQIKYLL